MILTLLISLITILIFGTVMNPVMERMDVMSKRVVGNLDNSLEDENQSAKGCSKLKLTLSRWETNYFSPLFIK